MFEGDTDTGFLTIGQFSRLSHISVRMLRHYDKHGVIAPAFVDEDSAYRFYAPEQLADAIVVCQLRDVGLPVAVIAHLMPVRDDPEALRSALAAQQRVLEHELDAVRGRLGDVERWLQRLEDVTMTITIEDRTIAARTIVGLRQTIAGYGDEGQLWERLGGLVPKEVWQGPGPYGAIYHDDEYRESDVDVEVFATVAEPLAVSEPAHVAELPAVRVLSTLLEGDYSGMPQATAALGEDLGRRGLKVAGPMLNHYLVGPATEPDPTKWRTEVCLPVAAA